MKQIQPEVAADNQSRLLSIEDKPEVIKNEPDESKPKEKALELNVDDPNSL